MGILVCWTGVVTVFIVALIFVAIPIVMAGGQKANPARNKNVTDPSPNLPPSTDFSTRPSWHPVCDLQVTKQNPEGKDSILVLRDSLGPCSKVFVRNAGGSNNSTTTWNDLQPTVESIKSMGNLPHLRTGDAFLSIDHGFDLRQDRNWTLSFSGARLSTADNSFDILFSAQGIGEIRYEADDNALGIYVRRGSAGRSFMNHRRIPLPLDVSTMHVLTLSHHGGNIWLYQNARPVTVIDFEEGLGTMEDVGGTSYDGPFPSQIAVRRIAYFDEFVKGERLAALVLRMSL
jgi:hypothetical protein